MKHFEIVGDKEIDRFLKRLPNYFRKEALEMAAKPAAIIVKDEAKSIITSQAKNTDGQSKAAYVARNVRALRSKNKRNPGYNVYIKGKDIPVGDRFWTVQGYAVLFGEGSYRTRQRLTRSTGANRGYFRGFGNPIDKAGVSKGALARNIMLNNIKRISDKALRNG